MQKARRHPPAGGLRPLVSTRFQVLFTPLFGVLFTFPSRYWFTIGLSGVFSLTGWCRQIPTGRLRPRSTQELTKSLFLTRTQLSCSMAGFPTPFRFSLMYYFVVLQPPVCRNILGLGFFHFARHYSGNHYCFLFLCLLRCFSSARSRLCDHPSDDQVSPFGNLRITLYLLIPGAYRSLSRPSSPLRAKASPVYPFLLSSTIPPFARYVCFFDSCCVFRFTRSLVH